MKFKSSKISTGCLTTTVRRLCVLPSQLSCCYHNFVSYATYRYVCSIRILCLVHQINMSLSFLYCRLYSMFNIKLFLITERSFFYRCFYLVLYFSCKYFNIFPLHIFCDYFFLKVYSFFIYYLCIFLLFLFYYFLFPKLAIISLFFTWHHQEAF